jgi:fibronectin-binding autotransporter adhesin
MKWFDFPSSTASRRTAVSVGPIFPIAGHLMLILLGGSLSCATATEFFWNNGAATGLWNTTDANWTGTVWENSTDHQALFTSVGGTVILSEPITVGAVTHGSTAFNTPDLSLSGSSLNALSLTVQGRSVNSGAYSSNPSLTLAVPTVSIAGDLAVGRANLLIAAGSVTADRIISSVASADWARLVIFGGTVTATHGVDGSVNTGATFAIDLNGGALHTPSIRVADREIGINNNAWLTFNGGKLIATADNPDFITLYGGNQNAYIGNGGAVIDTAGHEIGIQINLLASGGGGLSKEGQGRLTLSGSNKYCGATKVRSGTLRLTQPSLQPAAQ